MKQQLNEIKRMQQLAGILSESNIKELSPLTRNLAAATAADKNYSSDSQLVRSKTGSQYDTFTQLPKELHTKGEELAKKISDFLGADRYKHTLKKIVNSTTSETPPYITYKVETITDGDTSRIQTFTITVEKDKFEESQYNPTLSRELTSAVLAFVKKLQTELQ